MTRIQAPADEDEGGGDEGVVTCPECGAECGGLETFCGACGGYLNP